MFSNRSDKLTEVKSKSSVETYQKVIRARLGSKT